MQWRWVLFLCGGDACGTMRCSSVMGTRAALLHQVSHRVFTLDVALALLELPEREVDGPLAPEHEKFLKHKFLVQEILVARCRDKAPTVRSKALSSFALCLESSASAPSDSIQELLHNSECAEHPEPGLILAGPDWVAEMIRVL